MKWVKASSKPETKIPKLQAKSDSAAEGLQALLQRLLEVTEKGEWDELDSLVETLLPELDAASQGFGNSEKFPVDRKELERAQALLQLIMDRFLTRQRQIAPLLDALAQAKKLSESP